MFEQAATLASLGALRDFWIHWGFEAWSLPPFEGVARKQRFVKSGLLGPVAEFMAWDCIIWKSGTERERLALWHGCRPLPDVVTQRFLFLLDAPWPERRIRSFAWGFRGYLEFFAYYPGFKGNTKVKDLTGLVDLGLNLACETTTRVPGAAERVCAAAG